MTGKKMVLFGLLVITALIVGGCLVSGTFVVTETFSFIAQTGFYGDSVDLTDNEIWAEHQDKLDRIELIGFELWVTNNEPTEWSFWAYLDDYNPSCVDETCADTSTTKFLIFDTLTIPASSGSSGSQKIVTYAESFNYITNLDSAKVLLMSGQFNFFGYADGGTQSLVDSVRVVVTINASDS